MELTKEDQHLNTLITPYGCFKYCRGLMGLATTGDVFCLRGDIAFKDGISEDEDKAICDNPTITNLTDLHSFMGLVNQLAEFTRDIAQHLCPLMTPRRCLHGPWITMRHSA
ncbi:hypothetical protein SK128_010577, partial [Halocaridina rubra]